MSRKTIASIDELRHGIDYIKDNIKGIDASGFGTRIYMKSR